MSFIVTTGGIGGDHGVRPDDRCRRAPLRLGAQLSETIEWLSDNGSGYGARDTRGFCTSTRRPRSAAPRLGELPVKGYRESKKRFRDTLRDHPDLVGINAGRSRLSLARQAGIACMAEDTAATIRAENSLEVALAHQIAAAHNGAMLLQAPAMDVLGAHQQSQFRNSLLCADAVRMVNASGRMMDATQKAALVLNRLRTAGAQTMVVQHVHVSDGGQAVVAGKMRAVGKKGEAHGR